MRTLLLTITLLISSLTFAQIPSVKVENSKGESFDTKSLMEAGKPMSYVQTYYGIEEIVPAVSGRIVAVCAKQGDMVTKGEIVAFVQE